MNSAFGLAAVSAVSAVAIALAKIPEEIQKINTAMIEQANSTEETIRSWERLAGMADKTGDAAKLSHKISEDLAKASALYAEWRTKQLTFWQEFANGAARILGGMFGSPQLTGRPGPIQEAADEARLAARNNEILLIQKAAEATDKAARGEENWKHQQEDLAAGIPEVEAKIKGLNTALEEQKAIVKEIGAKGIGATDMQIADANAALDEIDRLNEALAQEEGHQKTLDKKQDAADRKAAADATRGEAAAHRELRDTLAGEKLQLDAIKSEIANIESSPFMTVDQKDTALGRLIPQEINTINAMIADNKAKLAGSLLDPATHNALQAAIQRDEAAVQSLNQKMQTTTFGGQLRASLVQWVNQFGTTAQQVGNLITSTIGTAVNGVSNAIMGAIFRTQTWGQAFAEVAKSIIGNIIQIVLQYAIQRGVMALINIVFGEAEAAASTTQAEAAAIAWSPAAIAASTASYGVAAATGNAAYIAALISGTATAAGIAAGGSFEVGGFTGAGSGVAGVVHRGEYVMPASTVNRAGGAGAMDNVRASIEGGGGRDTSPHIYIFTDASALQKHWRSNPASKKQVIDWVNSSGGNLRT